MDTVTQMLFGAVVAQAGFRRKLGRRALAAGAVVALVPDLDVGVGWFGGTFANWEHHRGLTHSLFFGPIVGPLLGWLLWRFERRGNTAPPEDGRLRAWIWLCVLALVTHPLIDLFTSYGTQLLYPFSTTRFAINSMPIIDPLYSLLLVAALVFGAMRMVRPALAQDIAASALILIGGYTLAGWAINNHIEREAAAQFARPAQITAYPMLFQPYYRRVVAATPEGFHVGYYSVLNPKRIAWREYRQEAPERINGVRDLAEVRLFDWFSMGNLLWRAEPGGTALIATDMRYGMPGPTEAGFWGIRVRQEGAAATVEPFGVRREVTRQALADFWSEMTGR